MTDTPSRPFGHDHVFLGSQHERNERRTWAVIALTTVMMPRSWPAVSMALWLWSRMAGTWRLMRPPC